MRVLAVVTALLAVTLSPVAGPATAAPPPPSGGPIFVPVPDFEQQRGADLSPRQYAANAVDLSQLRALLATAPEGAARGVARLPLAIPAPDGELETFAIEESSVLSPELAAQFPEIRTYAGNGISDPTRTIRLDVTPLGFHASVRGPGGERSWYVDPATRKQDPGVHLSYYGVHLRDRGETFVERGRHDTEQVHESAPRTPAGGEVSQRVYRLVMMSDPTYAAYWDVDGDPANSDAEVTAAKATLMNRVNQIYNDDLAIKMNLVGQATLTNQQTDAEYTANGYDPGAPCSSGMLNDNQAAVDTLIGSANYDVGHIALGLNGGGIAGLGVVGTDGQKARGCTGLPTPTGDFFAIDYVAHEIGHQYDGNHTMAGCGAAPATTRVEPGSGSSVMAYAGICGAEDLQPHTDPYFSQMTIDEVTAFVEGTPTAGGFEVLATGNHAPAVTAPADKSIPIRTPFSLTGSGTDIDDDQLTFLWEQDDPGSGSLTNNTKPSGPLFRVFGDNAEVSDSDALIYNSPGQNHADGNPSRTFPDMAQVLADNSNAEGGTCPSAAGTTPDAQRDCFSEFLPTAAYLSPLHFRLTARDGFAAGGGTQYDDVTLTPVAAAGPFLVTSQDTGTTPVDAGETIDVDWAVNGTNIPTLAENVTIRLSTDGGQSFPTELIASTPNDGTQAVTLPIGSSTTEARILVAAVDNYFFDVNDADFTIAATGPPGAPTVDDARAISRTSARVFITDGAPGGSAIEGYMVHCTSNDGGTTRTRATGSEPVTIRNMTAGAHYHCRARVENAAGFGPYSPFSPYFLQAVPPLRPTDVAGVGVTSTSADVSFTPGAERGAPVTDYQARCVSPNGGTTRARIDLANPIRVNNLTAGKNYRCQVRAISEAGNSPYSAYSPLFSP